MQQVGSLTALPCPTLRFAMPAPAPPHASPPQLLTTHTQVEHRLMLGMAPDYDHLTVIQKVEVFEHAMDSTSGECRLEGVGAGWLLARSGKQPRGVLLLRVQL